MRKYGKVMGVAAALALGVTGTAKADGGWSWSEVCGGNNFETCAAVDLSWVSATSTVTLTVKNLGDNGEVFEALGIFNLPAGTTLEGSTLPTGWVLGNQSLSGAGFVGVVQGAQAPNPAPKNGLKNDGTELTFVFDFSNLTEQQLAALGVGIHAISGPNGCSTKLTVNSSGSTVNGPYDPNCQPPTTTVPEPISMTLLATGLAGMSGVNFMKRRRKNSAV